MRSASRFVVGVGVEVVGLSALAYVLSRSVARASSFPSSSTLPLEPPPAPASPPATTPPPAPTRPPAKPPVTTRPPARPPTAPPARPPVNTRPKFTAAQYPPGSPEQIALFEAAAKLTGLPLAWARDPGLIHILTKESGGAPHGLPESGWVGIPNYSFGKLPRAKWPTIWAELRRGVVRTVSTATGLGQLILPNVDAYYPDKRAGIGDPLNEAAGMLRYIKARYGTPAKAWALYGTRHQGY